MREEDLLEEIARVLAPGGKFVLRVPATGALAGFDAYNLSRYFIDITRHGHHPSETNEIGWRKHYPTEDLTAMITKVGLTVTSVVRSRLIISELLEFAIQTRWRWLEYRPEAYRAAHRNLERVRRFEDRIRFAGGFLVTIEAIKPL